MSSNPIVMDMTTTRPEFFRCLDIALRGLNPKIDGNHIRAELDGDGLEMTLSAQPPRALSQTLKLERWKLSIQFNGQSTEQRRAFMKIFERAFHRGGG